MVRQNILATVYLQPFKNVLFHHGNLPMPKGNIVYWYTSVLRVCLYTDKAKPGLILFKESLHLDNQMKEKEVKLKYV